ncbi:MAG: DUF3788 domain-containing protein [Coriobacteriales bacterium]|jgi:AraC family transcriptional regulator|nr:DUF3788 domain-containing protein [Coriobacteriales bacterium]
MQWSELYDGGQEPSNDQIQEFVATPLWDDLSDYLLLTYRVRPKLAYSNCALDNGSWRGWNAKYRKSGKALCTLYPRLGYFTALVVIGAKEAAEAALLITLCSEYTQQLYDQTESSSSGKWLMLDVTNADVLRDVKNLIALRAETR